LSRQRKDKTVLSIVLIAKELTQIIHVLANTEDHVSPQASPLASATRTQLFMLVFTAKFLNVLDWDQRNAIQERALPLILAIVQPLVGRAQTVANLFVKRLASMETVLDLILAHVTSDGLVPIARWLRTNVNDLISHATI